MVAADTNVLVRLLTNDDPSQANRAEALLRRQQVWIAKTVLLETAWVLQSLYEFSSASVMAGLRGLAGLENVHFEDALAVAKAFEWCEAGLEFADALHLASRGEAKRFVTFDEKFVKRAGRITSLEVDCL